MIMQFLGGKTFYRWCQWLTMLLVPTLGLLFIFVKIERKIITVGVVESRGQVTVRSPVSDSLVRRILKNDGDEFRTGDAILEFYDLNNYGQKQARTRLSLERLERRRDTLVAVRRSGSVSAAEMDEAEYAVREAQLELQDLTERVERYSVRTPFDGKVVKVLVEPYQKVEIGTPLCTLLGNEEHKLIKCMVPENQFARMQPGQTVYIKSQLYNYLKFEIFEGILEKVSPYGVPLNNNVHYEVVVSITRDSGRLRVNSAATCEIITGRQSLFAYVFNRE